MSLKVMMQQNNDIINVGELFSSSFLVFKLLVPITSQPFLNKWYYVLYCDVVKALRGSCSIPHLWLILSRSFLLIYEIERLGWSYRPSARQLLHRKSAGFSMDSLSSQMWAWMTPQVRLTLSPQVLPTTSCPSAKPTFFVMVTK